MLAGLVVLGLTQMRARSASLARVSLMPLAMIAFSALGLWSAFGRTSAGPQVVGLWILVSASVAAALGRSRAAGSYDPVRREYRLPGSVVPLLLILGIFLVKWTVGVEMAMQPRLATDATFALSIAAVYGVFSGVFAGRAARLWRLALRSSPVLSPQA